MHGAKRLRVSPVPSAADEQPPVPVLDRLPPANGEPSSIPDTSDEEDDTMVTVFPCVQVVQEDPEQESELAAPGTIVLDALVSSSDSEGCSSPPQTPLSAAPPRPGLAQFILDLKVPPELQKDRHPLPTQTGPRRLPPLRPKPSAQSESSETQSETQSQSQSQSPPQSQSQSQSQPATRTIVVRRSDGSTSSAVVRLVPPSRAKVGSGTMNVQKVVVVSSNSAVRPPPRQPHQLPPQPPLTSQSPSQPQAKPQPQPEPLIKVLSMASGELSEDLSDVDSSDGDSLAEVSSGSELDEADRQKLSGELRVARCRLSEAEDCLRRQRLRLHEQSVAAAAAPQPDLDARYPAPPSPPPLPEVAVPAALPEVRDGRVVRAALRRLQRRHWQLYQAALSSALHLRRAQRSAAAGRLDAYAERHRLRRLLSPAQWAALRENRAPQRWPEQDLRRAGELRAACGDSGYRFLREQWDLPLPELDDLPPVAPPSPAADGPARAPSPQRAQSAATPPPEDVKPTLSELAQENVRRSPRLDRRPRRGAAGRRRWGP